MNQKVLLEFDARSSSNESNTSSVGKNTLSGVHQAYFTDSEPSITNSTSTTDEARADSFICKICFNKCDRKDNYIILSCNHVFHVHCLVETHFNDIYKFNMIDDDYFTTRKCLVCAGALQTEELMFLHSKFLNTTRTNISKHQEYINSLETQIKVLKDELRTCFEYKNKLEYEREKSKQIVTVLTTMM